MEAGYGEYENIGAFLSEKFCEEFNHYVPDDENFSPQQPCEVVQSPNRSCQPIVDVDITPTFQTTKSIASTQKRSPKCIQVDESELTSMEGKVSKHTILCHFSQIMK